MQPVKPKDFLIFYNLVDFCQYVALFLSIFLRILYSSHRDLLPDQTPELFQKWIFRFLYDIISSSTKFVHISFSIKRKSFPFQISFSQWNLSLCYICHEYLSET